MPHRDRKFHLFFHKFLWSVADTQNAEISGIHGGVESLSTPVADTQKPETSGFCGAKWILLYLATPHQQRTLRWAEGPGAWSGPAQGRARGTATPTPQNPEPLHQQKEGGAPSRKQAL